MRISPPTHRAPVLLAAICSLAALSISARAESWLFDFGAATTATTLGPAPDDPANYWNNITETIAQSNAGTLLNLISTTNAPTDVDFLMVSRFNGVNSNGTTSFAGFAQDATRDSLYGNIEAFGGLSNVTPIFKLASLDPLLAYNFSFYASRMGAGGDNRNTEYDVVGATSGSAALNVSENISTIVSVNGIKPNASGEITISLTQGVGNNNANHFIYLGVMRMESVPEPVSALVLASGVAALALRRRRAS
jgi:MYXO-CTERM domain-containing protein